MNKKVIQITPENALAVLGPKNTYTDLAADKYVSSGKKALNKVHLRSINDIFYAVEKGRAGQGIVPLENVIYGSVRETYDLLSEANVHIIEKFKLKIEHVLVTLPGTKKSEIHLIASHEQALQQCREYLQKYYQNAQKEYCTSTMAALEKMVNTDDRGMAVIIPKLAAEGLPLKIIAKNVQDVTKNYTTFIVLEKGPAVSNAKAEGKRLETSIAFHFRKDSPGRLYMVFREFANAGINLSHIESRPSADEPGNYIFFLNFDEPDIAGSSADVLEKIRPKVAGLKILGTYKKQ